MESQLREKDETIHSLEELKNLQLSDKQKSEAIVTEKENALTEVNKQLEEAQKRIDKLTSESRSKQDTIEELYGKLSEAFEHAQDHNHDVEVIAELESANGVYLSLLLVKALSSGTEATSG